MRILLDTNILIPLEDSSPLSIEVATVNKLATTYRCTLLCHPSSILDFKRDKNTSRRSILLSKIRKYSLLDPPPRPNNEFLSLLDRGTTSPNEEVDNDLLYAVFCNSVNFLVTEDKGIHRKAKKLNLDSKVYNVAQCIDALRGLYERKPISLPNIEDVPVYQLSDNAPIFNSIKDDYPNFTNWFKRVARENRKAWVIYDGENIGAVLIYKEEPNEGKLPVITDKMLKMCTFKVSPDFRGRKIGELLLKACFNYCLSNRIDAAYLTFKKGKQQELLALCLDFGFTFCSYDEDEDACYKTFLPPAADEGESLNAVDYHIQYYPHYNTTGNISKYIIPVRPVYHEILFPDCQKQLSLFSPNEAVSNSILKAYICNSKIKKISPGDLALFYRSGDWKCITTLGIVEQVYRTRDPYEVASIVSKRTVYSFNEIEQLCEKEALVILFRQISHLTKEVSFSTLKETNVIRNNLESITAISDESFVSIVSQNPSTSKLINN